MTPEVRARMSASMLGNRNACGKHKKHNILSGGLEQGNEAVHRCNEAVVQ
jgi:hypothetical protein